MADPKSWARNRVAVEPAIPSNCLRAVRLSNGEPADRDRNWLFG